MPELPTKALVTGASGLLGNNIVRSLIEKGFPTRVLLRENSDPKTIENLDVEVVYGDARDKPSVENACLGVSWIFHAAARVKIGGREKELFRSINTEGTRNLAQAARDQGARLVYISTSDTIGCKASGEPSDESAPFDEVHASVYSRSKYEGELAILEATETGLDGVIVNPSFMLGPWDWKPSSGTMLSCIGKGLGWIAPRGFGCFTDVRDVTDGIIAAAERGRIGERYLLTGETLSYCDAWKLFAEITQRNPPLGTLGPVTTFLAGRFGDLTGRLTRHEPVVNSTALKAAECPRKYSYDKARTELNYCPRPLRETAADAWAWLQEHGR